MFRQPQGAQGFQPFGQQQRPQGRSHGPWPPGQQQNDWQAATTGNGRNPNKWAPDIEHSYPFRHWMADTITWCMSSNEDELRKGPLIEMALGGLARDFVREMPLQIKVHGAVQDLGDGQGPQQLTGAAFILNGLASRFMPLQEETNLRALADLYGFFRLGGESIDSVLTRFELVVQRARTAGGIQLQIQQHEWMFLLALNRPSTGFTFLPL